MPFPDSCTAAKQHPYSITSLASASSLSGRSSPSVLAVLRLITSSYLMGACIGKAGPRERWDQWTYIRGGFLSRAGRGRIHYSRLPETNSQKFTCRRGAGHTFRRTSSNFLRSLLFAGEYIYEAVPTVSYFFLLVSPAG